MSEGDDRDRAVRWIELLDTVESRLGVYAATLVGCPPPPPFEIPDDLGPCPEELRSRAKSLIDRQHDIENAIRARLGFLRQMLDGPPSAKPSSVFVDASA